MTQENEETKKEVINVMVDIETLSTRYNAAILSIGATTFLTHEPETFYTKIKSIYYSGDHRFHVDDKTLAWWDTQDTQVKKEAFSGTLSRDRVLTTFCTWLNSLNREIIFWSYGANFDEVILNNALTTFGIEVPWKYRNVRCFRTLVALNPLSSPPFINPQKHNALADAVFQAAWAQKIFWED